MNTCKFQMREQLKITVSDEVGEVIGRAEYAVGEPAYLLRYRSADGRAMEIWWVESALATYAPLAPVSLG